MAMWNRWRNQIELQLPLSNCAAHVRKVLRRFLFVLQMRNKSMEKTVARIITGSMWILKKKSCIIIHSFFDRFWPVQERNVDIHCGFYGWFSEKNTKCALQSSCCCLRRHRRCHCCFCYCYCSCRHWANAIARRDKNSVDMQTKSRSTKATTNWNVSAVPHNLCDAGTAFVISKCTPYL